MNESPASVLVNTSEGKSAQRPSSSNVQPFKKSKSTFLKEDSEVQDDSDSELKRHIFAGSMILV